MRRGNSILRKLDVPAKSLADYSRLVALLRRAAYVVRHQAKSPIPSVEKQWQRSLNLAAAHPEHYQLFDNGTCKTLFTTAYRRCAVELADPRIHEGLQISLAALQRMQTLAKSGQVRLIVLLIPTKETVFQPLCDNPSENLRVVL